MMVVMMVMVMGRGRYLHFEVRGLVGVMEYIYTRYKAQRSKKDKRGDLSWGHILAVVI